MLISLNWIREFCPFETSESPREIGARFSLHAAEVEHVEERGRALDAITTARVLEVSRHPNAERLTVVRVEVGGGINADVVCGAPNVREGMVAPYAAPGTVVDGQAIAEVAVRGVVSKGMLCSQKELGISEDHSGLWDLPSDAPAGTALLDVFPALRDVIIEIDNKSVTHRPDLWGHHGIAREFAAIYGTPLEPLRLDGRLARAKGEARVRVSIDGDGVGGRDGLCRRYCGLQIDGVRVAPSPAWLQLRLLAIGSRPISNIVDVTNYILFEIGQPLHAFDTDRVGGGEIRVRRALGDEVLKLLDGSEVKLTSEDCVIADAESAVALAGIMGGASSEISDATTSLFLESANFAPASIRRSSIRLGTRTDSSLRFEKSLDPENARIGILRAARMILDLCPGAKIVGSLQDVGYDPAPPIEITTTAGFIASRLGTEMPAAEVRGSLDRLGFAVRGRTDGTWKVRVPSWRATKDISLKEDLVEEVGRIHGYGRIAPYAPEWKLETPAGNRHRLLERRAKEFLVLHGGLCEIITHSMVGAAHCEAFGLEPGAHLRLVNAISEDMDRLRREIVPIHLEKARENQRFCASFGLFELGRVYRKSPDRLRGPELPEERAHVAGLRTFEEKRPENFYAVRGIVLGLLEHLKMPDPLVLPPDEGAPIEPWAHPAVYGRVLVGGVEVGRIYRVHPGAEARLELKGDTIAFDLDFESLNEASPRAISYSPPARYPSVPFDVAVVAAERIPVRDIMAVIRTAAGDLLRSVEVFDVFRGAQSGEGNKSVAFHVVFGADDRTLRGEEVTEVQERIMAALAGAGYPLRQ